MSRIFAGFSPLSVDCVRLIFQIAGCAKNFVVFFRGKFACCLRQMYLCIVFMVLDLRLKEDWFSGYNQFFCTCTFYRYEAQPTKTQSFMELKKVALFDLDGVVLDTEGQYTVFWQTIGERYCTEVPDFSTRIKGMSLVQILASHEKLQQHEHEIRKAIDEYEETMSYPYIPGAYAFLCALREARVPRAVVTSSNRAKMENVYRLLPEFESLFDRVFTADDITRSKPAPDCYLNAAHRMGADPTECVVFEDSINGLKSGRAAGAYVVGLSTSCAERDIVPLAEMVVPSFVDATTCLALFEKTRGR